MINFGSLLKSTLVFLCFGLCCSTQSMEKPTGSKDFLNWLNPFRQQPPTLAQRIAQAMVNNSEHELKELLLNGFDINHISSVEFLKEVRDEIRKLLVKKRMSTGIFNFLETMQQNCLYEGAIMADARRLSDWLFEHGHHPARGVHILESHLDLVGRELMLGEDYAFGWTQDIINNPEHFPYQHLQRQVVMKRIFFLAAAHGRKRVIDLILASSWSDEITNDILAEALTRSSLPGHVETVRVVLDALAHRLVLKTITEEALINAIRKALTWSAVQGRVEAVKLLLEFAQLYDLGIGWEPVGDRVDAIINNPECDPHMLPRLTEVLELISEYAENRFYLIHQRQVVSPIGQRPIQTGTRRASGLPAEIVAHIESFIS